MDPHRWLVFVVLASGLVAPVGAKSDYVERRAAMVKVCEAVDPAQYQSGLAFNPDGMKSYFPRSECFQRAALTFRDESLCVHVKERWTLLWSSWAVSDTHCRKLVAEGMAADRKSLGEVRASYLKTAIKLRDFSIVRNGNGRDFEIIPSFDPGTDHSYTLRFDLIVAGAREEIVPIHSSSYFLHGKSNIRIYVSQAEIRKRFPGFELDHPYPVRATLTLDVASGGYMWTDAFLESVFPAADRSQYLVKRTTFRP